MLRAESNAPSAEVTCGGAYQSAENAVNGVRFAAMNVLGIDAGGTRTVCLLVDDSGNVLGDARGPGANLQSAGELEVEKVLHDVIGRALGQHPQPKAICLGMAGVDRPGEAATIRQILERIGHRAQVLVVNDALIALEAGVPGGAGTVVVAGTGSIAYGRDAAGRAARSGGWGYVLGDEGSGYWLGRLALRAVVRAADGRGAPTAMAEPILSHFGVTKPQELVRHIYVAGARPSSIAALAQNRRRRGERLATQLPASSSASVDGSWRWPPPRSPGVSESSASRCCSRAARCADSSCLRTSLTADLSRPVARCRRAPARHRAGAGRGPAGAGGRDGNAAVARLRRRILTCRCWCFRRADTAALAVAGFLAQTLRRTPDVVLGLPTGRTMIPVYRALVRLHEGGLADFSRATTFNLDEFIGLPPGHPGSFRAYHAPAPVRSRQSAARRDPLSTRPRGRRGVPTIG